MKKSIISVMFIAIIAITSVNVVNAQTKINTPGSTWVKEKKISDYLKNQKVTAVYNFTFSDMNNPSSGNIYLATNKGAYILKPSGSFKVRSLTGSCYWVYRSIENSQHNISNIRFANYTQLVNVKQTTSESTSLIVDPTIQHHYCPYGMAPFSYKKVNIEKITGLGALGNYALFGSDKGVIQFSYLSSHDDLSESFITFSYQKLTENLKAPVSALYQKSENTLLAVQDGYLKVITLPGRTVNNVQLPSSLRVEKIIEFKNKIYLSSSAITKNLYESTFFTEGKTGTFRVLPEKIHGLHYIYVNKKILKINAIAKSTTKIYVAVTEIINAIPTAQIYSVSNSAKLPSVDYSTLLPIPKLSKR
ncbi:MAG: hypothetical protein KAI79_12580 [Bacteroidales bacterium]|nr:hypothetical protein [Bacteroidales bacterium]